MKRSTFEEIDAFLATLNGCSDVEAVITLLSARMNLLGFEKCAYWLRWPQTPGKPHIILSTYPDDYVRHYQANEFGTHDMVGRLAVHGLIIP